MAGWGVESAVDGGSGKEGALSQFISKSLSDVQKSADQDIKLMKARAKSFRDLATTLDREWENFRFPTIALGSSQQPLAVSGSDEFIRRIRPTLSSFRRIQSEPSFNDHDALPSPSGRSLQHSSSSSSSRSRSRRAVKDDWEPLRRMRQRFKELESSAAQKSKSPSQLIEKVKSTELFDNVKTSLRLTLPSPARRTEASAAYVPPLDVPELLESLVRQSEPFLDQLGVRKDVSVNFCKLLRSCKRAASSSSSSSSSGELVDDEEGSSNDERVASVLQSTGYRYKGGLLGESHECAAAADSRRRIAIVTTASLPWMTGTAVNPLFRAAYLAKDGVRNVTLVIPWLSKADQHLVYPDRILFNTPEEQESYVRTWLEERVGFKPDFKIAFYPGKFSKHKRSILACGDISQCIPDKEADVAVLEEPEHLTWYYHGRRWNRKFRDVIGIVHTNYLEYVKREKNGALQAFLLKHVNNWVVGIYCNKVLRLSAATQELPRSQVLNVHGVNPRFLEIGKKVSLDGKPSFSKGAYFLGKMLWGKGYRELVDMLAQHKLDLEDLKLDVFGSGEDAADVKSTAHSLGLAIDFHQGRDHADESLHSYKVFINPSVSDVVCTTTAEALAMGKFVVCADHPSNHFFTSFPNCLTYKTPSEFVDKVKLAMASDPVPLSPHDRHRLSWEAATERFLHYAAINPPTTTTTTSSNGEKKTSFPRLPSLRELLDGGLAMAHHVASGFEPARLISGAMPGTMHFSSEQSKQLNLPLPLLYHVW